MYIEKYKIFESRYKNRNIFGKISDFVSGREDMTSIVQPDNKLYSPMSYYRYDVNKKQILKFIKSNPNYLILLGLSSYQTSVWDRWKLIKLEVVLDDLLKVVNNRLDILCIEVDKSYEWDEMKLKVTLREKDFQVGDSMPDDIYNDYIDMIRSSMKKKKDEYLKRYNILQSQKTPQKMKFRSIRLYSVRPGYRSKFDDDKGIIKIEIDPRL